MLKKFNVIVFDVNKKAFVTYDIMPYLMWAYVNCKTKRHGELPITREDFLKFVEAESMYQFWSRCEYEVVLVDWPCQKTEKKIDVWDQIKMNIDHVTDILMENVAKLPKTKAAITKFLEREIKHNEEVL